MKQCLPQEDLDQQNLPDPVHDEMDCLELVTNQMMKTIEELKSEIVELSSKVSELEKNQKESSDKISTEK